MEYFLGQIVLFPYSFTPMGWLKCDGSTLSIQQHSALFSLHLYRYRLLLKEEET
jgi:microcystin-dependent protein